jgi:hypothetical protein
VKRRFAEAILGQLQRDETLLGAPRTEFVQWRALNLPTRLRCSAKCLKRWWVMKDSNLRPAD